MKPPEHYFPRHRRMTFSGCESSLEWTIWRNPIRQYMRDFLLVDHDDILFDLLIKQLPTKQQPTIIDLMATPHALRSLLKKPYCLKNMKGLAVGLQEVRPPEERPWDKAHGITYLTGDLNWSKTMREIASWLGEQKAHLIMERGFGALSYVPTYIHYYRAMLARLWSMLDPEGGTLVLQIPPQATLHERGIPVDNWVKRLTNAGIYHQYIAQYESIDWGLHYGLLLLRKHPGVHELPDVMDGALGSVALPQEKLALGM